MAEVAVVTYDDRDVYGVFPPEDAERVAQWLRNQGNRAVRVTITEPVEWPPMPHDGCRRLEVATGRGEVARNRPIAAAPEHYRYVLNDSLSGGERWERRDEHGALVESLTTADLRERTERFLADGYSVVQWVA